MTTVPREKGCCCGGGQEQLQPGLGMVPMGPHSLALSPASCGRSLAKRFGAVPAAREGARLGVLSLHWPHCQARLVPRQLAGTFQPSAPSTASCWSHPCPGGGELAPPGAQLGACREHQPWAERFPEARDPRPALPPLPPPACPPFSSRGVPKAPLAMAAAWKGPVLGWCGHLHAQPYSCGLHGGRWHRLSSEFYIKTY